MAVAIIVEITVLLSEELKTSVRMDEVTWDNIMQLKSVSQVLTLHSAVRHYCSG
jgi:hypothetical protein